VSRRLRGSYPGKALGVRVRVTCITMRAAAASGITDHSLPREFSRVRLVMHVASPGGTSARYFLIALYGRSSFARIPRYRLDVRFPGAY
jgi:hypothetical protein